MDGARQRHQDSGRGSSGSERKDDDNISSTSSSTDAADAAKAGRRASADLGEDGNPCYITVENERGKLEKFRINMDDDQFTVHHRPYMMGPRNSIVTLQDNFMRMMSASGVEPKSPTNAAGAPDDTVPASIVEELARKSRKRLIAKGGRVNVNLKNIPMMKSAFLKDVFTTAIDMPWRYTILAFAMSFFFTWTVFAVIWWIIGFAHGDFEEDNLPGGKNQEAGTFIPCVWAIHNFASCYLFSVETQHTIGYGSRQTTEECPEAIIIMSIQSIAGVFSTACMSGIVFAKLARPKNRSHTVVFSKNAVVTMINGQLFLIFRVGNIRKSHLIESHVRAILVHSKKTTKEGEVIQFAQEEVKVSTSYESDEERVLMLFPATIFHRIDSESPFYSMEPKEILDSRFEMVVSFEGIVEPTGNSVQVRTSYLPREILWGFRFENMVSYSKKPGTYLVDCSHLNAVVEDETPRKSMKAIDEQRKSRKVSSKTNLNRLEEQDEEEEDELIDD